MITFESKVSLRISSTISSFAVVFLLFFMLFPFYSFSQHKHKHEHIKTYVKNKKDSSIKVITNLKRDDGKGEAIILQRNRNDSAADQWIKDYINSVRNKLHNLNQTMSSGCSNLDFEDGNFNSWTGQTGTNNGYPAGSWVNGITAGRHTIVSGGSDPYASAGNPIPLPAPGGGTFSVKLGNDNSNYEAEQLIYTFTVQPQDTNFIYKYAVVLQDPQHTPDEQPYFDFQILDQNGNGISCSYQHYVAGGSLAGFFVSPTSSDVWFKPWTTVGINLSSYVGQQITLIATTADCSQGAHFGYAYLDFVCPSFSLAPNIFCDNQTSAVLTVPTVEPGMSYNWSTGGTTSSVTINPQLYDGSNINCFIESPTSLGICGFWYVFPIQVIAFDPDFSFTTSCLAATFTDSSTINSGLIQSWLWDFGDGNTSSTQNTSHTFNNAGTYNVTLTVNTVSCGQESISHSVTVTGTSTTMNSTNILCFGLNNATASVISTGAPPYTYVWTPNPPVGQGTNAVSGLSAGDWSVQVSDNNGCIISDTITVTEPTAIVATIPSSTDILCFGGNNGTATASASGGTGSYTYLWNDPAPAQTTITATNLTSGTWTVQISDANNCSSTASVSITDPVQLTAAIPTQTNISCFGGNNGSATATAAGGTGIYSYLWNDPAPAQTTISATNLTSGTWTIQVTDANNCIATASVTITQPALLAVGISAQTNISCNGGSDGSLTAIGSGGTLPYSFLWSDNQANATATGLGIGNYIVTITDALNCTASINSTISQPSALQLSINHFNVLCFGASSGSADLNVTGGTLPYASFLWSNTNATEDAVNLSAGIYCVTVTDANGCTDTSCVQIYEPPLLASSINTLTDISCHGGNDGTASITVNGGVLPYSYSWLANPLNNSNSLSNLSAGISSVFVNDANGCAVTVDFTLTEPLELTITTSPNVTICSGGSTTMAVNPAGGTMPYFYFWNNQPGASALLVNPTTTTSYLTYVVDINGCFSPTASINVTVMPPVGVNVTSLIDSICPGDSTQIFISAFNGNGGPYTLTIPDGTVITSPFMVTPQTNQQYIITATDGCNSSATDAITIYLFPVPPVNIIADKYEGCPPLRVQFNETSLNAGQSYLWNFDSPDENNLSFAKNPVHVFDVPGSYDVSQTITSINGCKAHLTIPDMITVYPMPEARFTYTPISPTILNPLIEFTNLSLGYIDNYWSFGDGDSSLMVNPDHLYRHIGDYTVALIAISDKGCRDTSIQIVNISDVFTFYAPTAFSPDNDGKNDFFFVYASGIDETSFHLYLYDRWGELIFNTEDMNKGWDGKVKGEMSQIGTFAWIAIFKDFLGNQKTQAGKVTLIR